MIAFAVNPIIKGAKKRNSSLLQVAHSVWSSLDTNAQEDLGDEVHSSPLSNLSIERE
jgi:hypothetical protein